MSIYVKGFEMPKNCGPHEILVTLFVREDGTASLWGKKEYIPHEPLEVVPVPPHGRLVDLDALWEEVTKICDRRDAGIISDLARLNALLSAIACAPTIIEAEE